MDPKIVGKKLKEIYPNDVAKDGRRYSDIPDAEIGAMFVLKHGDKAYTALGIAKEEDNGKDTATLRKEFAKESKDSNVKLIQDAYSRIKDVPNTGSGDLSLLYSYIKALDPTSVVREGEINISKATASVPENLLTAYKRVKEGKLLSSQQRQEYKGEISRFYNEKVKEQQERNRFYSELAADQKIDPKKIIGDYANIKPANISEVTPPQQNKEFGGPLGALLGLAGGASDFLLPETKKIPGRAQDIVNKQIQIQEQYPNTKGNLGEAVKRGAAETAAFIPSSLQAAVGPAVELSLAKSIPALFRGGVNKLGGVNNLVSKTKDLFKPTPPKLTEADLLRGQSLAESGKKIRTGAIEKAEELGKRVSAAPIKTALDKWAIRAKRANPLEENTIDNLLNKADDIFTVKSKVLDASGKPRILQKDLTPKAAKELWDDAFSGFTAAGTRGSSMEASYHRVVRDALRKELDTVAPGFEKATAKIKKGIELEDILGTVRTSKKRSEIKEGLKETPKPLGEILKKGAKNAGTAGLGALGTLLGLKLFGSRE